MSLGVTLIMIQGVVVLRATWPTLGTQAQNKKMKEIHPPPPPPPPPPPTKKENLLGNGTFQFTLRQFLILQETETLEKLLIFSSRKLFLYFSIRKTWKSFLYFKKRKPCKNFLYFRKLLSELKIWKNLLLENFLYFSKWSF